LRHILVMGICGTGKTTVAGLLAAHLRRPLVEADDYHAAEAIERMARGEALTDADRWDWLDRVAKAATTTGSSTVIACSALKRAYRARLVERLGLIDIVFLQGSRPLVTARMSRRTAHYMPTSLIDSQLADLEPPKGGEVLTLEIADPPDQLAAAAYDFVTRSQDTARPANS